MDYQEATSQDFRDFADKEMIKAYDTWMNGSLPTTERMIACGEFNAYVRVYNFEVVPHVCDDDC